MNLTGIEWARFTWNPMTGCLNNCAFDCYARRMAQRLRGRAGYPKDDPFAPTYHEDKINEPLTVRRPSVIFTGSMGDIFTETDEHKGTAEPVPWLAPIFQTIQKAPRHLFVILTKAPHNIPSYLKLADIKSIPANLVIGVSITGERDLGRLDYLNKFLPKAMGGKRVISFEPMLGPAPSLTSSRFRELDWLIIGALTGPQAKDHRPDRHWVRVLDNSALAASIPVFVKDNLQDIYSGPQEMPMLWICSRCSAILSADLPPVPFLCPHCGENIGIHDIHRVGAELLL